MLFHRVTAGFGVVVAALSVTIGVQSYAASTESAACLSGTMLVVASTQSNLSLLRDGRKPSVGRGILKSLALSALTLGTFTVVAQDRGVRGSALNIPDRYAATFNSAALSSKVVDALQKAESMGALAADVMTPSDGGNGIDPLLARMSCARKVVALIRPYLHENKASVSLVMDTEMQSVVSEGSGRAPLAYVSYRSAPIKAQLPSTGEKIAMALDQFMAEHESEIQAQYAEGIVQSALMMAARLVPADAAEKSVLLGTLGVPHSCSECRKDDLVVRVEEKRVWVSPKDNALALKSVAR